MTYDQKDINLTLIIGNFCNDPKVPAVLVNEALTKTEIFHHLLACKLIDKSMGKAEFNFDDLTGIDEKLNTILEEFKNPNKIKAS